MVNLKKNTYRGAGARKVRGPSHTSPSVAGWGGGLAEMEIRIVVEPPPQGSKTEDGGCSFPRLVGGRDLLAGGLDPPDLAGVLGDGAVAGELSGSPNVPDHLLCPLLGVLRKASNKEIERRKGNAISSFFKKNRFLFEILQNA